MAAKKKYWKTTSMPIFLKEIFIKSKKKLFNLICQLLYSLKKKSWTVINSRLIIYWNSLFQATIQNGLL